MRRVLPILLAGFVAVGPLTAKEHRSTEDLLALEGPALFKAAGDTGYSQAEDYSTDELIRVADKLAQERKKGAEQEDDWSVFTRFFDAACEEATSAQLDQLIAIYERVDPSSLDKSWSFKALAAAWLAREISGLEPTVALPEPAVSDESKIHDASPQLLSAWKLYKKATRKADENFRDKPRGRSISFQANEAAFYRIIDDILLKRGENTAERLALFTWSGWCGTGSESLQEPQSIGIFMALLHDHRFEEAVGAALRLNTEKPVELGRQKTSIRIQFLTKCGLDWEAIFAGALLDPDEGGFLVFSSPTLTELAEYGSERAFDFISQLALRAEPHSHPQFVHALMAFLPPGPDNRTIYSSSEFSRSSTAPVPPEAKKRMIAILEKYAESDVDRYEAEEVVVGLARMKSPETKPALRLLLKHRSERVVDAAAKALEALGEKAPLPNRQPVQFRILANGKPLPAGSRVQWELFADDRIAHDYAEVDANGVINLPRVNFINHPETTEVRFRNSSYWETEAATFSVRSPSPKNLDAVTKVEVEVVPVRLKLERHLQQSSDEERVARIRILKHAEPGEGTTLDSPDSELNEFKVPAAEPLDFLIQKGTYDLEILAPGAARHHTTFDAVEFGPVIAVALPPGADLHFEPIRPDGDRRTSWKLFRDGKELPESEVHPDYMTQTYLGLPVGNYVLHINSSAEEAPEQSEEMGPLRPYAGKDIPIKITGEMPLVDLGEIHLDPAD